MTRSTHPLFANTAIAAIATVALFSAGASMAQEATHDNWQQASTSSKSRAEVVAELEAARQSGLTETLSDGYLALAPKQRQRDEVLAQTLRAKASGELKAINAPVYDFMPMAILQLPRSAN